MRRHEAICHNIRTIVDQFQDEIVLMLGERSSFRTGIRPFNYQNYHLARVRTSLGSRGVYLFHSSLSSSSVIVYKAGESKYKLSRSIETNGEMGVLQVNHNYMTHIWCLIGKVEDKSCKHREHKHNVSCFMRILHSALLCRHNFIMSCRLFNCNSLMSSASHQNTSPVAVVSGILNDDDGDGQIEK